MYKIGVGTGHLNNREQLECVEYAIELGANFIDTAEIYTNGRSEELIGKVIKNKRDSLFISTKVSPENLGDITGACEKSLKRLNTDYIDLYSIHWPSQNMNIEKIVEDFNKLKQQGKILNIGLSNFSLREIDKFKLPIYALRNEMNLVNQKAEKDIWYRCHLENILFIAYSPLDQGNSIRLKFLEKYATKYNKTVSQIILNYLSKGSNTILIPESYNKKHIQENITALDFNLSFEDTVEIFQLSPSSINIPAFKIKISKKGRENREVYFTVEEAIENRLNLIPSPVELSKTLIFDNVIKPVKINKNYELVEGRLRYWAQVIAFGKDTLIKSLVVEN